MNGVIASFWHSVLATASLGRANHHHPLSVIGDVLSSSKLAISDTSNTYPHNMKAGEKYIRKNAGAWFAWACLLMFISEGFSAMAGEQAGRADDFVDRIAINIKSPSYGN